MKKTYKYLWIMLFLIFSMSTVSADEITADSLTYNGKSQIVTATGNVIIQNNEGAIIIGNEGEYNFITHTAYITGNVVYEKDSIHMTAGKISLYSDHTIHGSGHVSIEDSSGPHLLKGEEITYQDETGFGKIIGNAYYESAKGYLSAPQIEGNIKEIHIEAIGGVTFSYPAQNAEGRSDTAVYTRSGINGTDGQLVLTGAAHVIQNGNIFDGPELIIRDNEQIVETGGRSTLVIQTDKS